jgi:type IV secretion system protein TrbF
VLQAARALQQINNQVTSLQNQTQMLLNQVRNLTSLPYSALQAIDQSIVRTQQLLNQAQRLAYDVNQIDQAFGRSYPPSYSASTQLWRWRFSQQLQRPARVGPPDAPPAGDEPGDFRDGPRHSFRRSRRRPDLRQPEGGPLMLFRRPSVRYGRTPEPETPYQKAAQAWDERIGAARVQARNWRLIAFGNLFLAAGLAGGLIWQAARGTVTPWVVEVDRLGQAQAVSPAIADYRPTEPQVAWHLARFIENVRSLPAAPVIVRQNWLSAYDFITDKGAVALNDYARANDPFAKVGKIQVAVDISSVIRASNDSFRVAWIERRYENTSLAATERWTAILTVVFDTPQDAERLRKNPLGVFVHAINWSKELG